MNLPDREIKQEILHPSMKSKFIGDLKTGKIRVQEQKDPELFNTMMKALTGKKGKI